MLDDEKLIAWFAMNIDINYSHPKLHPIPIGIAYSIWHNNGSSEILKKVLDAVAAGIQKKQLLYVNYSRRSWERANLQDFRK